MDIFGCYYSAFHTVKSKDETMFQETNCSQGTSSNEDYFPPSHGLLHDKVHYSICPPPHTPHRKDKGVVICQEGVGTDQNGVQIRYRKDVPGALLKTHMNSFSLHSSPILQESYYNPVFQMRKLRHRYLPKATQLVKNRIPAPEI